MARPTFRVHFVRHHDGAITGRLLSSAGALSEPFSGYAQTEAEVLAQLSLAVEETRDPVDEYLWRSEISLRKVRVKVHPQSVIKRRHVIAKQQIELSVTYFWTEQEGGGLGVMVPRFGWWFVLESIDMASAVIRQAIGTALLGERPRSVYEFRGQDEEWVSEWSPALGSRRRQPAMADEQERLGALHAVAEELTSRERKGRRRAIVGRVEVDAYLPALLETPPRSLLLVGPPGSGKTTWVRALARTLINRGSARGDVPRLWSTSADRIVAGMRFLGQWEQRCLDLVGELSGEGDLLYVDRMAPLCADRSGHSSIADMLAPAMRSGELGLIAECSELEYQRLRSDRPGFVGLFRVVRFEPAPARSMPQLLAAYQQRIDGSRPFSDQALRQLVQLLDFFARDVSFPGKGFRFLDWLAQEAGQSDAARAGVTQSAFSATEVSEAFARSSGLPLELISEAHAAGPDLIASRLREGVIGQDQACMTAARVLTRFKTGLTDPGRPIGSLFFVGPTGVGKTELAKQLARYMFGDAERMLRLDMSEFMLAGSGPRLLATGRGVRSLVEAVRQNPLSLILLDEVEKAHPEVFDLLLAMLGEGRMTDADGRLVDFRMTLVVMTSNLGVQSSAASGFGSDKQSSKDLLTAVRAHFRPEFFNRIDHVAAFGNLSRESILAVVDLELKKASRRVGLVRRGLRLQVHVDAKQALAKIGWHATRGARPLKRALEEHVMSKIAVRLAEQRTVRDQTIHVVAAGSEAGEKLEAEGAFVVVVSPAAG